MSDDLKEKCATCGEIPSRECRVHYAKEINRLKSFIRKVAALDCLYSEWKFRGECGRDGEPKTGWCVVCLAKDEIAPVVTWDGG